MKLIQEFRNFLEEYRVIGLAIAVILGLVTNELIVSLVRNILMPLIDPLIKEGTWDTASFSFAGITLQWGTFLSSFLHFIIILLIVFVIVKIVKKKK
jgi:large conductance mechanosensitive channel